MKRRDFLKMTVAGSILFFSCKEKQPFLHPLTSDVGQRVTLEGEILHVCPIEKEKMKLKLADGETVRVLPSDNMPFDKSLWDKKRVRITGLLQEMRLGRDVISSNYKEKKLLCHIDHSPCLDAKWVENHWKNGTGEELLKRDNEALLRKMSVKNLSFIQVFSIVAENISEI